MYEVLRYELTILQMKLKIIETKLKMLQIQIDHLIYLVQKIRGPEICE